MNTTGNTLTENQALWVYIKELEKRIAELEKITKQLRPK